MLSNLFKRYRRITEFDRHKSIAHYIRAQSLTILFAILIAAPIIYMVGPNKLSSAEFVLVTYITLSVNILSSIWIKIFYKEKK